MTELVAPRNPPNPRNPGSLDAAAIAELLAAVDPFAALDGGVRADIARVATEILFDANEPAVRQGDPGDAVLVLLTGSFEVVVELEAGGQQTLAQLGPGACVGELALLTNQPRAATVIARTEASALRIPADAFQHILDAHADAKRTFVAFASRRLPSLRLASSGLFVGVDPAAFARFDRESNWVRIAGGQMLFRQGDRADDMYIVVHGGLEVIVQGRGGVSRAVDVVGPGATIGEMALVSDEPRSATVRAIRDSELVRITKHDFMALVDEHPRSGVQLARTLVERLRQTTAAPRIRRHARTIALVPSRATGIAPEFAPRLADALAALGDTVLRLSAATVDAELGAGASAIRFDDVANGRLLNWLNEREAHARYVIYECDATLTPWTERCLRQADLVLAIADAAEDPEPGPVERALLEAQSPDGDTPDGDTPDGGTPPLRFERYELVLLHPRAATRPSGTRRWLDARARRPPAVTTHHHVRLDRGGDVNRLARSIAGASTGLALSGGGARGFAQIGVMKVLAELGIDVDHVGGTSMGSVLGGLLAMNYDLAAIEEMAGKGFVGYGIVRDLTPPAVSFLRGSSFVRLCKAMFGEVQIEDLWLPYFAVSTNLSRAEVVVHDTGPLWKWIGASSSVPGITPPIPRDGDLLVDGGVLNNLPVDVMRARCRGSVIAVDSSARVDLRTNVDLPESAMSGWPHLARALTPFARRDSLGSSQLFPNIVQILARTATLSSVHNQDVMKDLADLYLHPPTDDVPIFDWAAIHRIVDIGYRYAYDLVQEWMVSDARHTGAHAAITRTGSWDV